MYLSNAQSNTRMAPPDLSLLKKFGKFWDAPYNTFLINSKNDFKNVIVNEIYEGRLKSNASDALKKKGGGGNRYSSLRLVVTSV